MMTDQMMQLANCQPAIDLRSNTLKSSNKLFTIALDFVNFNYNYNHMALMFVVFCHLSKCVLVHIRIKGEVGDAKLV